MNTLHVPTSAIAAAVLSLSLAGTAAAQGTTAPATKPGSSTAAAAQGGAEVAAADREFAKKAAIGGLAEVAMGSLAQQRAEDPQVKQFGERMVEDHGRANAELQRIAGAKNIELPAAPDKKHLQQVEKLQKLSGAEFDRAYMKQMVDAHQKDVSAFEDQAKSGKDADLKAFAQKTLPTLQEHLKQAKAIRDSAQAGKSGANGTTKSKS